MSHSDWPPTGHNDLNIDKQPNPKKAPQRNKIHFGQLQHS